MSSTSKSYILAYTPLVCLKPFENQLALIENPLII